MHDTALFDILGGVGIPGHERLIDHLIKPGAHWRENNLSAAGFEPRLDERADWDVAQPWWLPFHLGWGVGPDLRARQD